MVSKRTGRPRGRPHGSKLAFLDDRDRYLLALIEATMEAHGLAFEPAARLALCGWESMPVPTETLSRAAQKRLKKGWQLMSFERINPKQDKTDARIDTLRLKSKRFANDEPAQRWLHNMRNAWLNLLQHERVGPAAELLIFKCCEAAGESAYAKEHMLPVLRILTAH
jgi:hypothetical protein